MIFQRFFLLNRNWTIIANQFKPDMSDWFSRRQQHPSHSRARCQIQWNLPGKPEAADGTRLQGLSTTFFRRYKYFFECLLILSLNKAHYSQKKMQEFLRRTITVVQVALNYGRKLRRVITINSNPLSKIIFEFINNIRYNKPISLSLIVL